jgi:acyl-CoA thioesterase-1
MNLLFKIKKIIIIILLVVVIGGGYIALNKEPNSTTLKSIELNQNMNQEEFKIVAFGDSLTAGLGVDLKDSYPSILEGILNTEEEYKNYKVSFSVINMGVSGETTNGGLDRVDFILEQEPDLVLLGLGANDMFRMIEPSIVEKNITTIVEKITRNNIPIILLGMQSLPTNGREYKKKFDELYLIVSKKYDVPLVPFMLQDVALVPRLNISDGIHPNRLGYEKVLNKNILPIISPILSEILK